MLRKLLLSLVLLLPLLGRGQDFSDQWEGHFSFYNVTEIVSGNDKIFAATENAIFTYNSQTNEVDEITTINGLSGETIATIAYSKEYDLLIVGYVNGLIEIKFDNDDEVLSIVDIIEKPTILPNNRGINHFNIQENLVYISTDYGISVYNLERLEFGDTFYIGNSGEQVQVSQSSIVGDYIYAACLGGNGIKKAQVSNPNIIDFNNWQSITSGNFTAIEKVEDQVYVVGLDRKIYRITNDVLSELFTYNSLPLNVKSDNDFLIVSIAESIFIYDSSFNLLQQIYPSTDFPTNFTSAATYLDQIYIGTQKFGVLKTLSSNPTVFEEIRPDGPLFNNIFSIENFNNQLWGVSGGYNLFYNFIGGNRVRTGISRLIDDEWNNIPYDSISKDITNPYYLSHVAINPFEPNKVFVSSYYTGLIEFKEDKVIGLFDENNSTLLPFAADLNLTATSIFDNDGALWLMNGRVEKPLNRYKDGAWTSFDFSAVIPDYTIDLGFSNIVIGLDGTKWIGSYRNGLIGFNENGSRIKNIVGEESNLSNEYVTTIAMDNRNQLWIGTFKGLRVLYNTSNFFENDDVTVNEIIILEDGEAKELLFQQYITDIEVDGSNNKWIGTNESGIFYFSSDGQETIFHFTTNNSPLPSNAINDISLDSANGIVYIATDKGLVSYNSGGSQAFEGLENTYVFPNPVRPGFDIVEKKVKIKDVSENVNIKITDIEGNLVAEAQSRTNQRYNGYNLEIDGGTAYWNGKNLANNVVASGVYLIMLSDLDTFETKVLKLMVVR